MGTDRNSPENRWLLDAMQRQIPVIYFLGTSPGPISAHHPHIHRRLARRAVTS
jgi:hypothetical protein